MASHESDLRFDSVLGGRSTEKRTALIVFPIVVLVVALVIFAGTAISRTSGLQTQLHIAQQQLQEANHVVDERDRQLRDAHGETATLATPGQGAAVLSGTAAAKGASGVVLDHPEQHALAIYAFGLEPPRDGQEYRLVVTDGAGRESLLGGLAPDARGAAFLLARGVPEGIAKVELALVPKAAPSKATPSRTGERAQGATAIETRVDPAPVERTPVLTGAVPRPGEAGVVLTSSADESAPRAQARTGRKRAR